MPTANIAVIAETIYSELDNFTLEDIDEAAEETDHRLVIGNAKVSAPAHVAARGVEHLAVDPA